jgi:signal transduction histidine kinase
MSDRAPRIPWDIRHSIIAFGLFTLIMLGVGVGIEVSAELDRNMIAGRRDVSSFARVFEEHIVRTLKGLDQTLLYIKNEYEDNPKQFDLNQVIARSPILKDISVQVGIIDKDGDLLVSSATPTVKKVYLGDREHFRRHVERDTGELFISKPVLGRASGKWSVQLARRLNNKNGGFEGVAVISLDPNYFTSYYGSVDLGGAGDVILVGLDGEVRARAVAGEMKLGQSLTGNPSFATMKEKGEGVLIWTNPFDEVERLVAWRRIRDFPLFVLVGKATSDIKSDVRHETNDYLLAGAIVGLLMFMATLLLLLQVSRQRAAEHSLRLREEELEAAQDRLTRSNDELRQFAHIIAHDLQEPARLAALYAQLVTSRYRGKLDADGEEFLTFIVQGATGMKARLVDLLEYVSTDPDEVVPGRTKSGEALERALTSLKIDLADCGARIEKPDVMPEVMADLDLLSQVFIQLIDNAIEYRAPERDLTISIAAEQDGTMWRFCVRDNGIGIEPQYFERIFLIFQRLHGESAHPGSGVGLSLCRKIIDRMGGGIWVESEPGQGSTFFFTLPVAPDSSQAA